MLYTWDSLPKILCLALRGGTGDPGSGREMEKVGKGGYLKEL